MTPRFGKTFYCPCCELIAQTEADDMYYCRQEKWVRRERPGEGVQHLRVDRLQNAGYIGGDIPASYAAATLALAGLGVLDKAEADRIIYEISH
jgi:hypothetical protein